MVQYTCWQCRPAVPNSVIVAAVERTRLLCAPSASALSRVFLHFIHHYPSISLFFLKLYVMCHPSLASILRILFFNAEFRWVNVNKQSLSSRFSCHCLFLFPLWPLLSLLLTVEKRVGQGRHCFWPHWACWLTKTLPHSRNVNYRD